MTTQSATAKIWILFLAVLPWILAAASYLADLAFTPVSSTPYDEQQSGATWTSAAFFLSALIVWLASLPTLIVIGALRGLNKSISPLLLSVSIFPVAVASLISTKLAFAILLFVICVAASWGLALFCMSLK